MAVQTIEQKREFTVDEAVEYNRSSPPRWVISHLMQYKGYLLVFVTASFTTAG